MNNKIYLASRYSRFEELRKYRDILEKLNFVVTSRWIDGDHKLKEGLSEEAQFNERQRFAKEDWEDMLSADTIICFTEEPRKTNTRGGRHVEFGGALALDKKCIIIGWRENVFYTLSELEFHKSFKDFLKNTNLLDKK